MATSSTENNMETNETDENSAESECILQGFANVNEFSQKALQAALMATRSSNSLPIGDDYDFYSTYRSVRDVMDIEGRRILSLLQRLLRHQNIKGHVGGEGTSAELEDKFDVIMDANDQILERAGGSLDEASGIRKDEAKLVIAAASFSPSQPATSWNKKQPSDTTKTANAYRLLTARNILRPQLQFQDKIDNGRRPFKPHLKSKPNALKSLEESLQLPAGVTIEDTENPDFVYPHPYKTEIESFHPDSALLEKVEPKEPQPLNLTPLVMVEKEEQLDEMITHLKTQTEIAVDLEAHSYRTFQGLTCLMQISTRTHDYVVDTLELRSHLHKLNLIFTDPKITKVLHGADSDVVWLQRDFGLYLVNMFDTGQAARVLGLSRFSLAYLMMSYCRVEADKQFQMADWRIRPLPAELIKYAREDTHYLLYIYDRIRNQLLDQGNKQANLLLSVYERSKAVSLKVYQKPVFHDNDYLQLYYKSKKAFHGQQMAALKDLFAWRDHMARVEDESLGYVLPNHMLLQIAEILPRERQGVLACCNPIPPLVRQSLPELHNIVLQAREVAVKKVEKQAVLQPSSTQHPKYNVDSLLNCPHDLTWMERRLGQIEQDILDTGLVANSGSMFSEKPSIQLKLKPDISAFHWNSGKPLRRTVAQKLAQEVKALFSSPFKKFLPKDESTKLKPQRREIWKLKPPTGVKRKADPGTGKKEVDLDSFEPEFVPPTKRPKVAVNLLNTSSTSKVQKSRNEGASLFMPPPSQTSVHSNNISNDNKSDSDDDKNDKDDNTSNSKKQENGGPSAGTVKEKVEKQIKSLRQEVNKKKKKEKKLKAKYEEKKKLKAPLQSNDPSTPSQPTKPSKTSDKKSNSKDLASSTTSLNTNTSVPAKSTGGEGEEDKKKKKKKKKLTVADVEENFTGFNYAAAEKNLSKAKTEKPDIYNPKLPSRTGKKDKGGKRPKLAGPNSTKNVIFGPGNPPKKQKK